MKPVVFLGDSRVRIREFPQPVRRQAGTERRRVQMGLDPSDWKPLAIGGPGVREIRVHAADGAFRVVSIARTKDAVYVLHAFQKKTQATPRKHLALAAARLKQI